MGYEVIDIHDPSQRRIIHDWKVGDRNPPLQVQVLDNGAVFDLTGASATFSMRNKNSDNLKVSAGAAVIDDAPLGRISFTPAATDTDTGGDFDGEFSITLSGGNVLKVPNGKNQKLTCRVNLAV